MFYFRNVILQSLQLADAVYGQMAGTEVAKKDLYLYGCMCCNFCATFLSTELRKLSGPRRGEFQAERNLRLVCCRPNVSLVYISNNKRESVSF